MTGRLPNLRTCASEQVRQPLHLVDDHPTSWRHPAQLLAEERGVTQVALVQPFVQKVETKGVGKRQLGPGTLADAAHPEQEEGLPGRPEESGVSNC